MTTIEQTIATLQKKRAAMLERAAALAEERQRISFDAHAANDKSARARLDRLHAEFATHASELESLDAALVTANEKLEAEQRAQETAADRQRIAELKKTYDRFVSIAATLDEALADIVIQSNELKTTMDQIHRLGGGAPTGQQLLTFGELALQSALMLTPWARAFRHLAPKDRRSFTSLAKGWAAAMTVTRNEEAA